jgi:hypothetical protein
LATSQQQAISGFKGAVGIATELTFGTGVAPTIYLPINTINADPANKLVTRMPVRRSAGQQTAGFGLMELTGTIDIRVDPVSVGPLFSYCMGTETTAASGASGTAHTFTLGAQNTATISIDYSTGSVYQYLGSKFNSLDITYKPGADLMLKCGWQGQTVSILGSQSLTPTYTNTLPFESTYATGATINGVAFDATDLSVALKNNNKPMNTATSGRLPRAINEMDKTVSGKFTYPLKDDSIFADLFGNSTGPTNRFAAPTQNIVMTFIHPDTIGTTHYSLSLQIPNAILEKGPVNVAANGELMQAVTFQAFESTPGAGDSLKLVLVNGQVGVY